MGLGSSLENQGESRPIKQHMATPSPTLASLVLAAPIPFLVSQTAHGWQLQNPWMAEAPEGSLVRQEIGLPESQLFQAAEHFGVLGGSLHPAICACPGASELARRVGEKGHCLRSPSLAVWPPEEAQVGVSLA